MQVCAEAVLGSLESNLEHMHRLSRNIIGAGAVMRCFESPTKLTMVFSSPSESEAWRPSVAYAILISV